MLPSNLQDPFYNSHYQVQSRTYLYYSRYPAVKPTKTHRSWHTALRRIGDYGRLFVVAIVMLVVGGIFPLLLSYELFFKQVVFNACDSCRIVGASPSFNYDFLLATIFAVLGFMMPILVLYIFIKIIQSRLLRHELFH